MASFTVRVVLANGEWDDYEKLYDEMAKQGFTKTIESEDGTLYELPPAEYNLEDVLLNRKQVMDRVKLAATTTHLDFQVLITEAAGRRWYSLEIVRP